MKVVFHIIKYTVTVKRIGTVLFQNQSPNSHVNECNSHSEQEITTHIKRSSRKKNPSSQDF